MSAQPTRPSEAEMTTTEAQDIVTRFDDGDRSVTVDTYDAAVELLDEEGMI